MNTFYSKSILQGLIIVVLMTTIPAVIAARRHRNVRETDWQVLVFEEKDKVAKVQLILKTYGAFSETKASSVDVTSIDEKVCLRFKNGITNSWRRVPQASHGGTGGEPYGELRVHTTSGEILIGLYRKFVLNDLYENDSNCFISFDLAVAVDDLHKKATGKTLDQKLFNALAGQHCPKSSIADK